MPNIMSMTPRLISAGIAVLAIAGLASACGGDDNTVTLYSGRGEDLVQPVVDLCAEQLNTDIDVRYGNSAEMLLLIQEEGANTPADVYYSQGAGFLGLLSADGGLAPLNSDMLDLVSNPNVASPAGDWVGITGRARTVAYNTNTLTADDLPDSFADFVDPSWAGRIGWAPTNASFQDHVTALRGLLGDDGARAWLEGIMANNPIPYDGNTAVLEAVAAGEVDVGFVNHYYLYRFLAEDPGFPVANRFYTDGDPGALVNVAGAGILSSSDDLDAAHGLISCLLSHDAQSYFAETNYELPVVDSVEPWADLPRLDTLELPAFDLNLLADLEGTVEMLIEVGAL